MSVWVSIILSWPRFWLEKALVVTGRGLKDEDMTDQTTPLAILVEPFLGFEPPSACREGIEANLKLLAQHTKTVFAGLADGVDEA